LEKHAKELTVQKRATAWPELHEWAFTINLDNQICVSSCRGRTANIPRLVEFQFPRLPLGSVKLSHLQQQRSHKDVFW